MEREGGGTLKSMWHDSSIQHKRAVHTKSVNTTLMYTTQHNKTQVANLTIVVDGKIQLRTHPTS